MEKINSILQKALQQQEPKSLQILQPGSQEEISIYRGELTPDVVAHESEKLAVAFPSLSPGFFNVLAGRLAANKFSNERLQAAIGYLLDNFKYQTPSISNIISFDKKVKLYSYNDVVTSLDKGCVWTDFVKIKRNDKIFWIKKTEQEQFNIPLEL